MVNSQKAPIEVKLNIDVYGSRMDTYITNTV